jgi:cytochrome c5
MKIKRIFLATVLTLGLTTLSFASDHGKKKKSDDIRDGKTVYAQSCAVCHSGGPLKAAPKLGNKADWAGLIEEGQQYPVAHGWLGTRQMPPRGGDPKITFEEFVNAVAFLGNSAGANWKEYHELDEEMHEEIHEEILERMLRNQVYQNIGKQY